MMAEIPLLDIKGLSYEYDDGTKALAEVSFSVARGEKVAVMGPNGAGKSTLLWVIAGVLKGFSGNVSLDGRGIASYAGRDLYRAVNIVFQNPEDQLFCGSVLDEIAFALRNMGLSPDEAATRARAAAEGLGIGGLLDREPQHLSFGQKKRLALASVLVIGPQLMLFDEPSSNLDFESKTRLLETISSFPGAGVIVTQDLPFAMAAASRLVYLDSGRAACDGSFASAAASGKCPALAAEIAGLERTLESVRRSASK